MMWGADNRTATVAIIVNIVKIIRQNLSTTMAANFQSLMTSASSSARFIRAVMNCSSLRMFCSSLCVPLLGKPLASSIVVARIKFGPRFVVTVDALFPPNALPDTFLKSSSMSSTFASRLLDERSFSSSSFIRLFISIVLRVIFLPGRLMPSIQGSHCKNTDLIWKNKSVSTIGVVQKNMCRFIQMCKSHLPRAVRAVVTYPLWHLVNIRRSMVVIEHDHS